MCALKLANFFIVGESEHESREALLGHLRSSRFKPGLVVVARTIVDIDPRNLPIFLHVRMSQVFGADHGVIQVFFLDHNAALCTLSVVFLSFLLSSARAASTFIPIAHDCLTLERCEWSTPLVEDPQKAPCKTF